MPPPAAPPYRVGQVADILHATDSTVRTWAGLYREFLSPEANAALGQHRQFTAHDLRILTFVSGLRKRRLQQDDIRAAIAQAIERGGLPPEYDPADAQAQVDETSAMIAQARDSWLAERAQLNGTIDDLRRQLIEAREALQEAQRDRIADIERLSAQAARLAAIVDLYEAGRLKPGR